MRALIACVVALVGGCKADPPASSADSWSKDGARFEGPAVEGEHYAYTLCPGGGYVRLCLDYNCDRGTWRHDGAAIVLVSSMPESKGKEIRLALTNGDKTLGAAGDAYAYAGAAAPAACGK